MNTKYVTIIRWTARIAGLMLIGLVVLMLFADGPPNPFDLTDKELQLFSAMIIMTVGLVIAYKREILGGLLATGGYIFFAVAEGSLDNGPIFPIFFIIGALYLYCGWKDKKESNKIIL